MANGARPDAEGKKAVASTLTGFIVVAQDAGELEVPAQVAGTGPAAAARSTRASRRASLAGRQQPYRLAIVTVVPSASQIRTWLDAHGWHPSPAGAPWTAPHGPSVGVPHDDADPAATIEAIERIAAAAGMTVAALMEEMALAGLGGD